MNTISSLPALPQINQWQHSFIALNEARTKAARELMVPRSQQVMDILPLLLHLHHPRLPGFVNAKVPTGIHQYTPQPRHLEALQKQARGLQLGRESAMQMPILGLYFMGSIGSVAQARSSDLDVWLCHSEKLNPDELKALRKKCDAIEEWALDQGVELHFFLMDLSQFRAGKDQYFEGESSGSSQHLLLLDEFYRSSVWIAGGMPRWWLIPNDQERNAESYWQGLVDNNLVDNRKWLDFGAVADIPAAEFIGAGLWQLHKGLSDPYKSLLKLQLTRHYASQYPKIRPLCWDLKEQVHQGNNDLVENDGYLLLLDRISEQLLNEGNNERVDLARRAFYYKAQLPLTQLANTQRSLWRTKVLIDLCEQWGWDRLALERLDERPNWSPNHIARERNALVSEMLSSYQYLLRFSQKNVSKLHISRQDMLSLGNRLYAAFDSRPGKVININPNISKSLTQETVALDFKQGLWLLIPKHSYHSNKVLKRSPSLVELLCFARLNKIIEPHTRVGIQTLETALTQFELRQLQSVISNLPILQPNSQTFLQPAKPVYWYVVVNAATDPQRRLSRKGLQKLSSRDNALGFSSSRENLVHTIDLITVNSWGEWQIEHFEGDTSLPHCLETMLSYLGKAKDVGWPEIGVHCYCASRAQAIRQRVEDSIQDVLQHFLESPKSPYLMEIAEGFYLFEKTRQGIKLHLADNTQKLLELLQRQTKHYVHYTLDRTALIGSPLRLIYQQSKAGLWQIFYWIYDGRVFFYFLDEKGVLLHQQWDIELSTQRVSYWLLPLLRFLMQLDQRWQRQTQRLTQRKITLFEIKRKPASYDFELMPRRLPDYSAQPASIELRAVLDAQQQVTFYCNGQEYSRWEYGEQLYQAVTEEIQRLRASHGVYPLFLTDLELSDNQNVIEHLQIRQRLSKRFMSEKQAAKDSDS